MPPKEIFSKDFDEWAKIDEYATTYQQKYGIPDYNEVDWCGKPIPWEKHMNIINNGVWGIDPTLKSTQIKPYKEKKTVSHQEKMQISNNRV